MTSGIMLAVLGVLLLAALMPKLGAFVPGPADAASVLQASVTKTADFASDWIDLGKGFAPGGLGMPLAGVVNVSAVTVDPAGAIALKLQQTVADANGAADSTKAEDIGAAVAVTATGLVVVKGLITSRFVRLSAAISGATSTMTYSANLNA